MDKKLGNKFDIKEFHDEVLKDGCLPLIILETKINRWIESKAAKINKIMLNQFLKLKIYTYHIRNMLI